MPMSFPLSVHAPAPALAKSIGESVCSNPEFLTPLAMTIVRSIPLTGERTKRVARVRKSGRADARRKSIPTDTTPDRNPPVISNDRQHSLTDYVVRDHSKRLTQIRFVGNDLRSEHNNIGSRIKPDQCQAAQASEPRPGRQPCLSPQEILECYITRDNGTLTVPENPVRDDVLLVVEDGYCTISPQLERPGFGPRLDVHSCRIVGAGSRRRRDGEHCHEHCQRCTPPARLTVAYRAPSRGCCRCP